ncbi:hypothetical protein H9635_17345 [Solibacillus sp. A46]|uniref:Uncharacterized protein n=2 Tax=Solibacillus TaxID=648800 RepID=A0ABR8Y347_9BACL|nr:MULTISPECIES: hypothetical protein [Solibacillus]MBD8033043.1 hypothetical protein [Solibacillus merdavium]MBD8038513.1 hypothetical protein [Solibacillus faecavium]
MVVFDEKQDLIYEGNLNNFEVCGEGKYYIDGKMLNKFNIPSKLLNLFKSHIFDFENLDLILHATFISENEIDINCEIKITLRKDGIKVVSGYIIGNKPLLVYVDSEPIEINILGNHNAKA